MRIMVRVAYDIGESVKATSDNVSSYVGEALRERVGRDRRREAGQNILDGIHAYDGPGSEEGAEEKLHRERRDRDRTRS